MGPSVFLSHSKKDKEFIEKIAVALKEARVSVWYDEWDIRVGESFTKQIFDEGIQKSDVFFVYLTSNSVESPWVTAELDAAYTRSLSGRPDSLAIFVDSRETRNRLSAHLQSLHCPEMNETDFERPLRQLIAKSWERHLNLVVRDTKKETQVEVLQLQKQLAEAENKVLRLEMTGVVDLDKIETMLKGHQFNLIESSSDLLTLFEKSLAAPLSIGANRFRMNRAIQSHFNVPPGAVSGLSRLGELNYELADFIGPLSMAGLVDTVVHPDEDTYLLTDLGKALARRQMGLT